LGKALTLHAFKHAAHFGGDGTMRQIRTVHVVG
jgi:hypothetical protein